MLQKVCLCLYRYFPILIIYLEKKRKRSWAKDQLTGKIQGETMFVETLQLNRHVSYSLQCCQRDLQEASTYTPSYS